MSKPMLSSMITSLLKKWKRYNGQKLRNIIMPIRKTIRLLNYLQFDDVDNLTIKVKALKHNSFEIQVVNEQQKIVLTMEIYRFPNQLTQWYIDIPVVLNVHQVQTIGDMSNNEIEKYLQSQSRYLRIFDKLHTNAIYEYPKLQLTMNIIEAINDGQIPEDEFSLEKIEFISKVIHHQVKTSPFGIIIEKSVKVLLKDSGLFNGYESTDIDEKNLNEALLLCDMMTI